ncbi:futalosine hydrolase [Paenibacillus tarimensis]
MKPILVMTAVEAEKEAVLRGLRGSDRFEVALAGVGPAAAAANTAKVLASGDYNLVISAGIGGGFSNRAEVGSIVIANAIIAADLGAETPEGYRTLDELGFGSTLVETDGQRAERLAEAMREVGLSAVTGPVLTVSTVTGTAETAGELAVRVPGAAAEAMEGYGVAVAARLYGLPVLELRAVSNPVGPRDRSAWRIREALQALENASSVIMEVL